MKDDQMMCTIPELKERRLTYDISDRKQPPKVDEFLVSIVGKKGSYKAGSVYQVAKVREIKAVKPRPFKRWELKVFKLPELVQNTVVNVNYGFVWVKIGEESHEAHPVFWHPRSKKK